MQCLNSLTVNSMYIIFLHYFFHCSKWKIYIVKKTQTPLRRTDCDMFADTSSPAPAKILPFQFKGKLKYFPSPWHYSQLSGSCVYHSQGECSLGLINFFMGYFFLCLPHKASLQNFLTRLSGVKWPRSYMGFPPHQVTPKPLVPADGQPGLSMCSVDCATYTVVFSTMHSLQTNSRSSFNMRHSICLMSKTKPN